MFTWPSSLGRGHAVAVGRVGDGHDRGRSAVGIGRRSGPLQHAGLLPRGDVPQADRSILAAGRQRLAVVRERQGTDIASAWPVSVPTTLPVDGSHSVTTPSFDRRRPTPAACRRARTRRDGPADSSPRFRCGERRWPDPTARSSFRRWWPRSGCRAKSRPKELRSVIVRQLVKLLPRRHVPHRELDIAASNSLPPPATRYLPSGENPTQKNGNVSP